MVGVRTDGYVGSSFEYIMEHDRPQHKSLIGLDPEKDHKSYLEFAEAGGTDDYATLLYYGDGSRHGCTFATRESDGFSQKHLEMIDHQRLVLFSSLLMPPYVARS